MSPVESCSGQSLLLPEFNEPMTLSSGAIYAPEVNKTTKFLANNEVQPVADKRIKDQKDFLNLQMSRNDVARLKKGRSDCLAHKDTIINLSADFSTKWEQLQQVHVFPGDLSTIFRHFITQVGCSGSDRLLQLALALMLPETLLRIKEYLHYLRQNVASFQPEAGEPVSYWIYRTAVKSFQGLEPQTFSRRLLQWYVFNYIQNEVGLWQPTAARKVNDVVGQICQSGVQGLSTGDSHFAPLHTVKRRIYSWYDQGREWNSVVQAAGSGNVLLLVPDKPSLHSLVPAVSATKYRNLDANQARVLIDMFQKIRQQTSSFLNHELLFRSFLFHRPPRRIFRLELLSDEDIKQVSIRSDQVFDLLTEPQTDIFLLLPPPKLKIFFFLPALLVVIFMASYSWL